jgi:hypothetical protein
MFVPCINSIKALFIIPTDAHNYKITGTFKTIKIPTIASTCFGSHRNHHQGAISCLAKTTIMILLCSSLMTWSMSCRHTSLLCKLTPAQQAGMPLWHWNNKKVLCYPPLLFIYFYVRHLHLILCTTVYILYFSFLCRDQPDDYPCLVETCS